MGEVIRDTKLFSLLAFPIMSLPKLTLTVLERPIAKTLEGQSPVIKPKDKSVKSLAGSRKEQGVLKRH